MGKEGPSCKVSWGDRAKGSSMGVKKAKSLELKFK